jgi:hypothetical protein
MSQLATKSRAGHERGERRPAREGSLRLGKLVQLACLDPEIVKAIVEGRQPVTLNAKRLSNTMLPLAWKDQRSMFGFA